MVGIRFPSFGHLHYSCLETGPEMGGKGTCPPLDGRQPHTPDPLSPLPPCSAFPSGGLTPPDAPALLPLGRRDANRTASPPRRRDAPASRARAGVRWPRPRPPTLAFRELRPLLSVASRSRRSGGALLSVRQSARRGARVTAAVLPEPRGPAELPAAVSEPLSPVSSRSPSPRAVAAGAAHAEGGAGRGGPRRRRKLPGCARAGLRGWGRLGGVRWVPFLPSLRLFAPPMAAWALETAAGAAGGAPKVVGAAGLRERAAGGGPLQRGRALDPRAPREAVPSVPSALCPPRARGVTVRRAARFAPPPPCRHRLAFSVARGGGITNEALESPPVREPVRSQGARGMTVHLTPRNQVRSQQVCAESEPASCAGSWSAPRTENEGTSIPRSLSALVLLLSVHLLHPVCRLGGAVQIGWLSR